MSLLNGIYTKNKKEGLSFRQIAHTYQLDHSEPGAIQAKATRALTAVGEPDPSSYLTALDDPDNWASAKTTSVVE